MKLLPGEKNWFNDIKLSASTYGIPIDEEELKAMSKETFKRSVKSKIQEFATNKLISECSLQTKTQHLKYTKLEMQPYLSCLYPGQAKTILKCRSQCLKIKTHRPFQFSNKVCRWCNLEDETLAHVVDCGRENADGLMNIVDLDIVDAEKEAELISLAARIDDFLDLVDF